MQIKSNIKYSLWQVAMSDMDGYHPLNEDKIDWCEICYEVKCDDGRDGYI